MLLDEIYDIEFEEWFLKLDELLQENAITQNAVFDYIANNPHYYMMSGKLLSYASHNYENLKLKYKLEKNKKLEIVTRKLEQMKKDKVITRQITNDFIEQTLIKTYPEFVEKWEKELIDAREVRNLAKILCEAYQARITGMQSINKKLYETESNIERVMRRKKHGRDEI